MNTAESKDYPKRFVKSRGLTLFHYNIKATIKEVDGAEEEFYVYNYVEIRGEVTRKKLIDALIRTKLDVNDEFAKMALDKTTSEYQEYRQFVESCKTIADEALQDV